MRSLPDRLHHNRFVLLFDFKAIIFFLWGDLRKETIFIVSAINADISSLAALLDIVRLPQHRTPDPVSLYWQSVYQAAQSSLWLNERGDESRLVGPKFPGFSCGTTISRQCLPVEL